MRKRQLVLEALEGRLVLSGMGQPDADQSGADWQSVIISFKDHVADPGAAASALVQSLGGQVGHVYGQALKGFSAQLPAAAVKGLSNNPMVDSIEPNQVVRAWGWPASTAYVVPHGVDRIDADLAASQTQWSNVDVAIIDTGIDPDHPDLNVNPEGVRFYTRLTGPPSSRTGNDGNFADDAGHGSHVAGIVGALENGRGVVGVAPGAKLWGVKVLDSQGYGTVADIAAGINWVVTHNAQNDNDIEVINMSLGLQGTSPALRTAIQNAVDAGIVVVVAAGNDAQDVYGSDGIFDTPDDFIPAAYPEVMTISAMVETDGIPGGFGPTTLDGPDDSFAAFSNFSATVTSDNPVTSAGKAIDLVLPGVNLWSAWYDGSYVQLSGTSMAAPHAAGLAARYIAEKYISLGKTPASAADVHEIRQALIDNAIAQDDSTGLGLTSLDDPDGNLEPVGWAGPSDMLDYPPALALIDPAAGATIAGTVSLSAVAFNDDGAVNQVEFFAASWPDGADLSAGADTSFDGSWAVAWDTTGLPDGIYKITAIATEAIGATAETQSGESSPIFVTIANGTTSDTPPSVAVSYPADGQTVSASVTVTADATDDVGVTQVEFFVGATSIGVDTNGDDGWSAIWETTSLADGPYTVLATATDTIGQTTSDAVSVTVDNAQASTTMHVADLDGSAQTIGRSGKWQALVDVLIVDAGGAPVSGASVTATWSGATSGSASGLTGSGGTVTFVSGTIYSSESVTFTVDGVSHPDFDYQPGNDTLTISPPLRATRGLAANAQSDSLEALYDLLAGVARSDGQQSGKRNADDQIAAVDLLMAYGL